MYNVRFLCHIFVYVCFKVYQSAVSLLETPIWDRTAAVWGLCRCNCSHHNCQSPSSGFHIWVSMVKKDKQTIET